MGRHRLSARAVDRLISYSTGWRCPITCNVVEPGFRTFAQTTELPHLQLILIFWMTIPLRVHKLAVGLFRVRPNEERSGAAVSM